MNTKDFDVIYQELCENNGKTLENKIKRNRSKILKIIGIIIVLATIMYILGSLELMGACIVIGCLAFMFFLFKIQEANLKDYREIIIKNLVIKKYSPKLNYDYNLGFKESDYINSKLPEKFDIFHSRDSIYGNIDENIDFKMSYISTYKKECSIIDGETHTETIETFKGIFGCANISKNIKAEVIIDLNDFKRKYNLNRIELESIEFEKAFDCFSDNKIVALQILTTDVIEQINELCSIFKNSIQIRIFNNMIFYRISLEEVFLPPKFKNILDRNRLKKIYDAINISKNIIECITESIEENI